VAVPEKGVHAEAKGVWPRSKVKAEAEYAGRKRDEGRLAYVSSRENLFKHGQPVVACSLDRGSHT
jgi:hypothetical protein